MKKNYCNSPHFGRVVDAIRRRTFKSIQEHFPELKSGSRWERTHGRRDYRFVGRTDITKLSREIYQELVVPLFLRPGINVRHEDDCARHRRDNAYCCIKYHSKKIKKAGDGELDGVLAAFRADFLKAFPGARFPFSWMIDHRDPVAKEWDELMKRERDFIKRLKLDYQASDGIPDELVERDEAATWMFNREKKDLEWARGLGLSNAKKRDYALRYCEWLALYMKTARGKPGRHPKEFNVLVFHIIKKCTSRKLDWKKRAAGEDCYRKRKDGQYRLETDWKLVIFLLLDLHVHTLRLRDIARFIPRYRNYPAPRALSRMQARLLNIRKNFPPFDAWPFPRSHPATGFRKLIVTEERGLRLVQL